MVETFYVIYVHCVVNTRLESVFIEKYSILLYKTYREISPSGSFPDFPKFSRGKFPVGKFPGFPEILPGESFPTGRCVISPEFFSGIHLITFTENSSFYTLSDYVTTLYMYTPFLYIPTMRSNNKINKSYIVMHVNCNTHYYICMHPLRLLCL